MSGLSIGGSMERWKWLLAVHMVAICYHAWCDPTDSPDYTWRGWECLISIFFFWKTRYHFLPYKNRGAAEFWLWFLRGTLKAGALTWDMNMTILTPHMRVLYKATTSISLSLLPCRNICVTSARQLVAEVAVSGPHGPLLHWCYPTNSSGHMKEAIACMAIISCEIEGWHNLASG